MAEMPNWEAFMIPTLRVLSDGVTRHLREFQPVVADEVKLTDAQRREVLSSGQLKYENRIGWGVSFLTNVDALTRPSREHYQISDAGRTLIRLFPDGVKEKDIIRLGEDPNSPIRVYQSTASHEAPPRPLRVARGPAPDPVTMDDKAAPGVSPAAAPLICRSVATPRPTPLSDRIEKLLKSPCLGALEDLLSRPLL